MTDSPEVSVAPAPKVSVVVTLYNTGEHLRVLVASLDAQTMPTSEFEVILVDDGSTDATLELARELAATRENVVVKTIPNSGWPGRPRNVGIDIARGDYIFFSDHDDTFGPRALERMHTCAVANDSDIVYGKIVRIGRSTPYWSVWARDVDRADSELAMQSRTVHKLYRRSMLLEHDMRFREGRARLEDHEFMALALSKARVVSIVASEPCYRWIHRKDGSNISDTAVDPQIYWGDYRHVLETWQRVCEPGELLDTARLVSATQAFTRFSPKAWAARTEESRTALFHAVHPLFRDHFPAELDARMPVFKRLRSQALRDGDLARFETLQDFRRRLSFLTTTNSVGADGSTLRVSVTARCVRAGKRDEPVVDRPDAATALLRLDGIEASDTDRALLPSDLGTVELTIRHRGTGVEWPIHTQTSTHDDAGLSVTTDAVIDLERDTFGTPLAKGTWDVLVRLQFLGESLIKRVETPSRGAERMPNTMVVADTGQVSFRVGAALDHRPRAARVSWRGRKLLIEIAPGRDAAQVLAGLRGDKDPHLSVEVHDGEARIDLDQVPGKEAGLVDLWAADSHGRLSRLAYDGATVDAPPVGSPRLSAYATAHNSLSVRRTIPEKPTVALRERALKAVRSNERLLDAARRFRR